MTQLGLAWTAVVQLGRIWTGIISATAEAVIGLDYKKKDSYF